MVWTDVPCWYTIRTDRFRTSSYTTVTMSTAPPFSSRVPMVQTIDSIWSMSSLGSYGGQSDDEDAPERWPQAPFSFWYRRHDELDVPPPSANE